MTRIGEGDRAPEVEMTTADGTRFSLADYRDKQVVVLFFYPKNNTSVCTKEACSFRDAYERFVQAGAVVIGVSGDSAESHQDFAAQHRLPFPLVSDPGGELRKRFGVPKTMGLLPGRVTYVIDREGVVRLVFNSQLDAEGHVSRALQLVQQLANS